MSAISKPPPNYAFLPFSRIANRQDYAITYSVSSHRCNNWRSQFRKSDFEIFQPFNAVRFRSGDLT